MHGIIKLGKFSLPKNNSGLLFVNSLPVAGEKQFMVFTVPH